MLSGNWQRGVYRYMNKKNLTYFKKRLTEELEDLRSGTNCNFNRLNDSEDILPDPVDRASSYIDRSLSQSMCDRENLRAIRIEQALEDLTNGDYGICQSCGEDITLKRLSANPIARHCISCKAAIETRERLTGA